MTKRGQMPIPLDMRNRRRVDDWDEHATLRLEAVHQRIHYMQDVWPLPHSRATRRLAPLAAEAGGLNVRLFGVIADTRFVILLSKVKYWKIAH